jgi:protein SCO1
MGGALALTDHTGQARTLKDYAGKVVVIFFGYTQCPDVCPTTLGKMAQVMAQLGERANQVQVLFVSLDPERDTPTLLAQYMPNFHQSFVGLRGTAEQTAQVVKSYHAFFQKQGDVKGAHYTIDHSTGSYIHDANGALRLYVRHDASAEHIAEDITLLLGEK